MDELDDYGSFNTRYEGVGRLVYLPGEDVTVYFEARQLADGRLLVGCISTGEPIRDDPVTIEGHLLSGEPFSTMWGRGITQIYRGGGNISKAHYLANRMRVRYTRDLEPDDHSMQLALHNFIPGRHSDVSNNRLDVYLPDCALSIAPVGNYRQQADHLLRYGGNLRTAWVKIQLVDAQGKRHGTRTDADRVVTDMLAPISLALGTSVTCPQVITFDAEGNRNDVEHYHSISSGFSDFIGSQGWDAPVKDAAEAWFSTTRPRLLGAQELRVSIHQHLDACSTKSFMETRALVAATLLDVLAGRYTRVWAPKLKPKDIPFTKKLERLLADLAIDLHAGHMDAIKNARNSLVHSGGFVRSERDKTYSEYRNLMLLGRSILLRLVGVPNTLHEAMES